METSFCYQIYFGTDDDVTSRAMEDEVDRVLLKSAILKLTDREKHIMELRFGFKTGVEKTQKEVADMLRNITKLHIKTWEKDNEQNEKRHNEQDTDNKKKHTTTCKKSYNEVK